MGVLTKLGVRKKFRAPIFLVGKYYKNSYSSRQFIDYQCKHCIQLPFIP
ncbi:hypothetical protein NTGHW29_190014 [Candidatus Nitrotoga sp. HW29]|nr:hypothetical protein NTGHW29_190014 [Candidatus Nitrotoga sp. HW29]